MRVAHISTVHQRFDNRIFFKEISFLKSFYDISLIVADGQGNEVVDNIKIIDIGFLEGRLNRILFTSFKMLKFLRKSKYDIVHFHDPELLLIAIPLRLFGKKVIYDSHEDISKQVFSKNYIPFFLKLIISITVFFFEKFISLFINKIICTTNSIAKSFRFIDSKVYVINNYPYLNELKNNSILNYANDNKICYIGTITFKRGIKEIVRALELLNGKVYLDLVGTFESDVLFKKVSAMNGWKFVNFLGQLKRKDLPKIFNSSKVGLVIFHPDPNHIKSQPNKLFEYMSSNLPIVCSDFELWRDLIEKNKCGLCVNPYDPTEISKSISKIINDSDMRIQMGKNGRKAIVDSYNWEKESLKLLDIYKSI
mgnify:CR=1 FL=1|tara:strand:- start:1959 stop:3056 length:1098 start_codon:yes stop_codon:yes gene_type:complete